MAAGLAASVELPASDFLRMYSRVGPKTSRYPLPGGTATWNEPSSLLATIASEAVTSCPDYLRREELHAGPGHRPAGPLFGHLAPDQHAAGELELELLLYGPLGPREFSLLRAGRAGLGGEGCRRK